MERNQQASVIEFTRSSLLLSGLSEEKTDNEEKMETLESH